MILNCLKASVPKKSILRRGLVVLAVVFICLPVYSENFCKGLFNRFLKTESSNETSKNSGSAVNRTPSEVKKLSRQYFISEINKVQPDLDGESLKVFSKDEAPRHFTYYDVGELEGEKVFLKEIKTQRELDELARYKVLKELGAMVLFQGVARSPQGRLYIVQRFIEGGVVSVLMIEGLQNVFLNEAVQGGINEFKKLFFQKGIYAKGIDLFISKDKEVFIINPGEYQFTGKMIRSGELFEDINYAFLKIESNIARAWAPLSEGNNADGFSEEKPAIKAKEQTVNGIDDLTVSGETPRGVEEASSSFDHLFKDFKTDMDHEKEAGLHPAPPGGGNNLKTDDLERKEKALFQSQNLIQTPAPANEAEISDDLKQTALADNENLIQAGKTNSTEVKKPSAEELEQIIGRAESEEQIKRVSAAELGQTLGLSEKPSPANKKEDETRQINFSVEDWEQALGLPDSAVNTSPPQEKTDKRLESSTNAPPSAEIIPFLPAAARVTR